MDARNLTAIPHSDAGSLEVIVPDGDGPYVGQATGIRALWPNGIIIHKSKFILSCLLYTSPSPRDGLLSRMPSSA